jgi:hypothetical protein
MLLKTGLRLLEHIPRNMLESYQVGIPGLVVRLGIPEPEFSDGRFGVADSGKGRKLVAVELGDAADNVSEADSRLGSIL